MFLQFMEYFRLDFNRSLWKAFWSNTKLSSWRLSPSSRQLQRDGWTPCRSKILLHQWTSGCLWTGSFEERKGSRTDLSSTPDHFSKGGTTFDQLNNKSMLYSLWYPFFKLNYIILLCKEPSFVYESYIHCYCSRLWITSASQNNLQITENYWQKYEY